MKEEKKKETLKHAFWILFAVSTAFFGIGFLVELGSIYANFVIQTNL